MFVIYSLTKNFISKNIYQNYFIMFYNYSGGFLYFRDAVNLSQNRATIGTLNNRNFKTQPKVSLFTNVSENNSTLASGSLLFLNKISLVLLLLNIMFVFKGNIFEYTKTIFFWVLFSAVLLFNLLTWLYIQLIALSSDVEINLGPRRKTIQTLSISH